MTKITMKLLENLPIDTELITEENVFIKIDYHDGINNYVWNKNYTFVSYTNEELLNDFKIESAIIRF
jgi:hypothetical protein